MAASVLDKTPFLGKEGKKIGKGKWLMKFLAKEYSNLPLGLVIGSISQRGQSRQ